MRPGGGDEVDDLPGGGLLVPTSLDPASLGARGTSTEVDLGGDHPRLGDVGAVRDVSVVILRMSRLELVDATGARVLGEIGEVFAEWNKGELESYLVEITAQVLAQVDAETGKPLVDVVVDQAGQKGTGLWTVKAALDLGIPVTGIAEAVFARALSSAADQRSAATSLASGTLAEAPKDKEQFVEDIRRALYASKMVAYAQGFDEISAGSQEYNWNVDRGSLATIWRGGCIIRAKFLNRIRDAYADNADLPSLLLAPYFTDAVESSLDSWRRVVSAATLMGVPVPAFASSISYYDGLRSDRLPAALTQGLRDYFGAHTYKRVDKPGTFHTLWGQDRTEVKTD